MQKPCTRISPNILDKLQLPRVEKQLMPSKAKRLYRIFPQALPHLLFFQLPSTFLPSKGRSNTTLRSRVTFPLVTMREVPQRLASPSEETPKKKKKERKENKSLDGMYDMSSARTTLGVRASASSYGGQLFVFRSISLYNAEKHLLWVLTNLKPFQYHKTWFTSSKQGQG